MKLPAGVLTGGIYGCSLMIRLGVKGKMPSAIRMLKIIIKSFVGRYMKTLEIKGKAKSLGIKAGSMKKTDLIHEIQKAEGYTPCFGTANGSCPNTNCCFMEDCLKVKVLV